MLIIVLTSCSVGGESASWIIGASVETAVSAVAEDEGAAALGQVPDAILLFSLP